MTSPGRDEQLVRQPIHCSEDGGLAPTDAPLAHGQPGQSQAGHTDAEPKVGIGEHGQRTAPQRGRSWVEPDAELPLHVQSQLLPGHEADDGLQLRHQRDMCAPRSKSNR